MLNSSAVAARSSEALKRTLAISFCIRPPSPQFQLIVLVIHMSPPSNFRTRNLISSAVFSGVLFCCCSLNFVSGVPSKSRCRISSNIDNQVWGPKGLLGSQWALQSKWYHISFCCVLVPCLLRRPSVLYLPSVCCLCSIALIQQFRASGLAGIIIMSTKNITISIVILILVLQSKWYNFFVAVFWVIVL